MEDMIARIVEMQRQGGRGALSWLVESSGSIPMSDRAKMLVPDRGPVLGTIGGGCLEAEIAAAGRQALETGRPRLDRYTLTEERAGASGLNCGGTVRIYTEPLSADTAPELYAGIAQAQAQRRPCVLATLLTTGSAPAKLLLYADGGATGTLGSPALDAQVRQCLPEVVRRDTGVAVALTLAPDQAAALGFEAQQSPEVFVEPYLAPPVLYVFGGGHVGGQIARLAKQVGFRVVVVDDRPSFASPQRHPDADAWVVEETDRVFDRLAIDEHTYLVAVTRGHEHDEQVVEQAIRTPARYIGMIGSERKKLTLWKRIEARGGSAERLARVYSPIGLNIGADTPEEIAVSVVAELIQVRRGARKAWKTKAGQGGG
jgi:xanthine dehydrogenase accessory factor